MTFHSLTINQVVAVMILASFAMGFGIGLWVRGLRDSPSPPPVV